MLFLEVMLVLFWLFEELTFKYLHLANFFGFMFCMTLFFSYTFLFVYLFMTVVLQAYAAEAGAERAEEPMEEAGMSEEIIQKARLNQRFA